MARYQCYLLESRLGEVGSFVKVCLDLLSGSAHALLCLLRPHVLSSGT